MWSIYCTWLVLNVDKSKDDKFSHSLNVLLKTVNFDFSKLGSFKEVSEVQPKNDSCRFSTFSTFQSDKSNDFKDLQFVNINLTPLISDLSKFLKSIS